MSKFNVGDVISKKNGDGSMLYLIRELPENSTEESSTGLFYGVSYVYNLNPLRLNKEIKLIKEEDIIYRFHLAEKIKEEYDEQVQYR